MLAFTIAIETSRSFQGSLAQRFQPRAVIPSFAICPAGFHMVTSMLLPAAGWQPLHLYCMPRDRRPTQCLATL